MKEQLNTLLDKNDLKEFFAILTENFDKINNKNLFSRFKKEYEFGKYDFDFKSRLSVWLDSEKHL